MAAAAALGGEGAGTQLMPRREAGVPWSTRARRRRTAKAKPSAREPRRLRRRRRRRGRRKRRRWIRGGGGDEAGAGGRRRRGRRVRRRRRGRRARRARRRRPSSELERRRARAVPRSRPRHLPRGSGGGAAVRKPRVLGDVTRRRGGEGAGGWAAAGRRPAGANTKTARGRGEGGVHRERRGSRFETSASRARDENITQPLLRRDRSARRERGGGRSRRNPPSFAASPAALSAAMDGIKKSIVTAIRTSG